MQYLPRHYSHLPFRNFNTASLQPSEIHTFNVISDLISIKALKLH